MQTTANKRSLNPFRVSRVSLLFRRLHLRLFTFVPFGDVETEMVTVQAVRSQNTEFNADTTIF